MDSKILLQCHYMPFNLLRRVKFVIISKQKTKDSSD